jgi:hypothetical protein
MHQNQLTRLPALVFFIVHGNDVKKGKLEGQPEE